MKPTITGIVIDQTREAGKWYVREVKDETGDGVKPIFFRREKSDLIGRLYDKLRGAESAQRYAFAHLDQLTEKTPFGIYDKVDDKGEPIFFLAQTNKITTENLEVLIGSKFKLINNDQPQTESRTTADGASSVTVIFAATEKELKSSVDQLWSSYKGTTHISRNDFKRLMQLSLQLAAGDVKSNDIKILDECKNFIGQLSSEGTGAWKNQQVPEKFQSLKTFFQGEENSELPVSTTALKTSEVAGPLSGFRPEGTELGPDQIFDKTHWNPDAAPPSNSDEIPWHSGDKMPQAHETRVRDAFRIHAALVEAVPLGQGFATVRADQIRDDLDVGNTADILKTLKLLRNLAKSQTAKQTINALGQAVFKYAEHLKTKN